MVWTVAVTFARCDQGEGVGGEVYEREGEGI